MGLKWLGPTPGWLLPVTMGTGVWECLLPMPALPPSHPPTQACVRAGQWHDADWGQKLVLQATLPRQRSAQKSTCSTLASWSRQRCVVRESEAPNSTSWCRRLKVSSCATSLSVSSSPSFLQGHGRGERWGMLSPRCTAQHAGCQPHNMHAAAPPAPVVHSALLLPPQIPHWCRCASRSVSRAAPSCLGQLLYSLAPSFTISRCLR